MRKVAAVNKPGSDIVRLLIYITEEDGTSLFEYVELEDGPCELDSWYETEEEAEEYCLVTYGIKPENWEEIEDPLPNAQHDWIRPVRIKGRDKGKPEWGKYEEFKNGKWIALKDKA